LWGFNGFWSKTLEMRFLRISTPPECDSIPIPPAGKTSSLVPRHHSSPDERATEKLKCPENVSLKLKSAGRVLLEKTLAPSAIWRRAAKLAAYLAVLLRRCGDAEQWRYGQPFGYLDVIMHTPPVAAEDRRFRQFRRSPADASPLNAANCRGAISRMRTGTNPRPRYARQPRRRRAGNERT
jgi:hypothetical protein